MTQALQLKGANFCASKAGLSADGGSASTYSTANTLQYALNGKASTKTAITNGTTPTTDYVTGAAFPALVGGNSVANAYGQGAAVLWGMVGSTVKCIMGKAVALDSAGNFPVYPQFPEFPDDFVPFAYQILKAGATAALSVIFGTANWNATGFTNTVQDILVMPNRPQAS